MSKEHNAQPHDAPSKKTTQEKVHWLTPGVWGISLASFLADVGHEVPNSLM